MTQIHHTSRQVMDTDPYNSQHYQRIDDNTRQYMHLTYADERLNYQTSYVTDEPVERDPPTVPAEVQRLRRRRGRQLRDEPDSPSVHEEGGPSTIHETGGPSNVQFTSGNMFGDMGNQDYYTPFNNLDEQSPLNLFNQPNDIFRGSPQMSPNFDPFQTPHIQRSSLSPVPFEWDIMKRK